MNSDLSKVLWIGGAPDSGKTTLARTLAAKHGLTLYEYDRGDLSRTERLAATKPNYRAFLDATMEERWMAPTPEELAARSLESFTDHWPLVCGEIAALRDQGRPILAEGFAFTPALVMPVVADPRQALWLTSDDAFKRASWQARGKPSWRDKVSDPERGAAKMWARNRLIVEEIEAQALRLGGRLLYAGEDGPASLLARAEAWWRPFLVHGS